MIEPAEAGPIFYLFAVFFPITVTLFITNCSPKQCFEVGIRKPLKVQLRVHPFNTYANFFEKLKERSHIRNQVGVEGGLLKMLMLDYGGGGGVSGYDDIS